MNNEAKVLLVTTTDLNGTKREKLEALVNSVNSEIKHLSRINYIVELHILIQGENEEYISTHEWVKVYKHPERISLSKARNILLAKIYSASQLNLQTVIAFPDDDASYPEKNLSKIIGIFKDNRDIDFFFCRYGQDAVSQDQIDVRTPGFIEITKYASSNTIFLRGTVALTVGNFDENLGLGAPLCGGEDTDFALRSSVKSRKTIYSSQKLVIHRDYEKSLTARYYPGALKAIANNAKYIKGGSVMLLRKILVGFYYFFRAKITARDLLRALNSTLGN